MPLPRQSAPRSETRGAPAVLQADSTADFSENASTSGGPTWYLDARPLGTCHDDHAAEWAIDCPVGDHEALAWRYRPGGRGSGWACPLGHRGQLWQLLPGAVR